MRRRNRYALVNKILYINLCKQCAKSLTILIVWPDLLFADVTNEINKQIATNTTGRLFAVIQLCGKQFKVTENDIIIIEGFWPPNIGERLKLEKVLLLGSTDFTLIGRPILNRELVSVDAIVIEKTLSHTRTRFRFRPRKQYRRINCKLPKLPFPHFPVFIRVNIFYISCSSF